MSIFDKFRRGNGTVSLPIPKDKVEEATKGGFDFIKEYFCACGARLKMRKRIDLDHGPSNYKGTHTAETIKAYNLEPRFIGHSIVQPSQLNWAGLAEERGWRVDGRVVCPACNMGLNVSEYKQKVRDGLIKR